MLSAFMGFIEPGDEVIIFEPFFDQSEIPASVR
jgi:aspartate/methionine/tyrosine aminotransferase